MSEEFGLSEGETCGREGCQGTMRRVDDGESCSCHINPPCSHCTDASYECDTCGEIEEPPPYLPESKPTSQLYLPKYKTLDECYAELDGSSFGYVSFTHTHFSMRKKGKCPLGWTMDVVREKVNGTFGGRFARWFEGINQHGQKIIFFDFIAYTD